MYEEVRSALNKERNKSDLQQLDEDFYRRVYIRLADLKATRGRKMEASSDPFQDPTVQDCSDEIQDLESLLEQLIERRLGKIVKMASFEAADFSTEHEALTSYEQELFDRLVSVLEEGRDSLLTGSFVDVSGFGSGVEEMDDPSGGSSVDDPVGGDGGEDTFGDEDVSESDEETLLADAMEGNVSGSDDRGDERGEDSQTVSESDEEIAAGNRSGDGEGDSGKSGDVPSDSDGQVSLFSSDDLVEGRDSGGEETVSGEGGDGVVGTEIDLVTIEVHEDMGEITGFDGDTYQLSSGDVVEIPEMNADVLVEGGAASYVDGE